MRRLKCLLAALLTGVVTLGGVAACAAPMPDWAIGTWIATSSVEPAEIGTLGESIVSAISSGLAETQMRIRADHISLSFSPYSPSLAWGVGLEATLTSTHASILLKDVPSPYVYGAAMSYDPDQTVQQISLTMEWCGEDGGHFESQTSSPIYRFPSVKRHCDSFDVFRFPDDAHLAIWRKVRGRSSHGNQPYNRGLVVFRRVPSEWLNSDEKLNPAPGKAWKN